MSGKDWQKNTGVMPDGPNRLVEVTLRNGETYVDEMDSFYWSIHGNDKDDNPLWAGDIVTWREIGGHAKANADSVKSSFAALMPVAVFVVLALCVLRVFGL